MFSRQWFTIGLLAMLLVNPASSGEASLDTIPFWFFGPDLNPTYQVTQLISGWHLVRIDIRNIGLTRANPSTTFIWFFNKDTGQFAVNEYVYCSSIDPGDSVSYIRLLPPTQKGYYLGIAADAFNAVRETNENNNYTGA